MKCSTEFESAWDALESDPVRVQNLKLRSELLMRVAEELRTRGLTQNLTTSAQAGSRHLNSMCSHAAGCCVMRNTLSLAGDQVVPTQGPEEVL